MEKYKNIEKFFLTKQQIQEQIDKGILIEDILHPKYVVRYNITVLYEKFWNQLGIKEGFNAGYKFSDAVFITDFHLIIIDRELSSKNTTEKFEVHVVPLEVIDNIEITERAENFMRMSHEIKKSPVKGAIIGGVIAGPTGAVIGATMNQGTKTVGGGVGTLYYWDLNIKFKNGYIYKLKDTSNALKSRQSLLSATNNKMNNLLERSKKDLTDINKKEIVDESTKDTKVKDTAKLIFYIIVIIISFVVIASVMK